MGNKKNILTLLFMATLLFSQFPIDLLPNEISDPYYFNSEINSEFHLRITANASTNSAKKYNE